MRHHRWQLYLSVPVFKFLVFLGAYLPSIPKDTYKINPAFYNVLGVIIYLYLTVFFAIYYRASMSLYIKFVFPFFKKIEANYPEKSAGFFTPSKKSFMRVAKLFFFSFFILIYTQLVIVCGLTIPKLFSPSLPISTLTLTDTLMRILLSSPIAAIIVLISLISYLTSLFQKIRKRVHVK